MSEPAGSGDAHYLGAIRRIYLHVVWLGVAGVLASLAAGGASWGVGFGCGAAISAINFRWLQRLVDALGPEPHHQPSRGIGAIVPFRYLLFGAIGYVIVKYFRVNLMAVLVGLFVAVAAVLLEIIYELIYART